ncbi:MAG: acyltransferase domain-containing protein, partial [Gemmatimonadetes bacterium]|nr:acyltransferase domain-containing protein [Gemmatimonadota bacterium]
ATLTSFKLGLEGPSLNVQSACSSSLVAVHLGVQSLRAGESDMVLAGGVSISLPQKRGCLYQPGGVNSPTGECRSFDADARGTVGGNGVGVVLLRRLEDALADGDTVLAVIRGSAVNNDGSEKMGYTAPRRDGQAAVIAEALVTAGVEPSTVSYVEAHGSGTEVGDPIEVAALAAAYGGADRPGTCALGSVKSNVGHLDAAAGVAGLIKTVLALGHGELPPSLHYERPNPRIDFARSPFFVNAALRPWERDGAPRRAGISSFGMGGTNAHLVVEEAPAAEPSGPSRPWQLLTLSARTPAALEAATDRLAAHLEAHPEQPLADVAHTLHVGRKRFEHRRVLVCRDHADAVAALRARDPRRVLDAVQERTNRPVAFLFPGLGDHYAQMARGLYEAEPAFRREVDRCAEILRPLIGCDVREVLFPGEPAPEQRADAAPDAAARGETSLRRMLGRDGGSDAPDPLGRTELAHPAVFVTEYALARTWMGWGIRPDVMIGHSLGEYVAATVAGVFSLEDALALVAERARLIEALPAGAMLAVPLDPAGIEPLLRDGLALAAVNAPGMCTVSGPVAAVERLEAELAEQGVACRRLNASHPFHSPGMEPIVDRLTARMAGMRLRAPEIPFVSNVTGRPIAAEEATDPAYWARHLCRTVRFAEGMAEVLRDPSRLLLEVGPGRTLGTFALRCGAAEGAVLASLRHAYTRQADQAFLLEMLGRSWTAGARVDWRGFAEGERRRRVLLPTYPFERRSYWVERRRRGRRRGSARSLRGEAWVVVVDGSGAGERLARRLAATGARVATVAAGEDPGAALEALRAEGGGPVHLVHPGAPEAGGRVEEVPELAGVGAPERAPDPTLHERPETGTRYVAPSGEVEELLAGVWARLLGYERVGAHDDFFALGGHSLLATQVIYRVREAFGIDLPLEAIFEVPTVAGLAGRVEEMRRMDAAERIPPVVRVPRTGPLPLSYAQERMWVLDQVEPGSPMYNVPAALELKGEVDVEIARRALAEIVRRHELLRTVYAVADDGQPVQVILPELEVPLPYEDLSHLPESEWLGVAGDRLLAEAQQPISLAVGPVMRTRLLRFSARYHVLLITLHHIVVDGWTWTLL